MKLTIVGCSGSYAGPMSPASCYLLEHHDGQRTWRILLDMGSGALGALQRHIDPFDLDAILFSHLHPDHCLDLCGFYVMCKYHPLGAPKKFDIYGPPETAARMARAYDLPIDPGMTEEFNFQTYPETDFEIGPFTISAIPVPHPVPAYAIRIAAAGQIFTYSGDTGESSSLVAAAKDADLFLCEAAFLTGKNNQPGVHLTGAEAAEHANQAGVKKLIVTHVPPWYEGADILAEATEVFKGETVLATAGATFVIGEKND